jgi:hypothetical protein
MVESVFAEFFPDADERENRGSEFGARNRMFLARPATALA